MHQALLPFDYWSPQNLPLACKSRRQADASLGFKLAATMRRSVLKVALLQDNAGKIKTSKCVHFSNLKSTLVSKLTATGVSSSVAGANRHELTASIAALSRSGA